MKRLLKGCLFGILLLILSGVVAQADIMEGYDVFEKKRPMRIDNTGRIIGATYVMDACDATAGWTALSNDTTGIEVDLDHVMGAASLEWDKVNGTDNLTVGGIQKTITAVNLTFLIENAGAFGYSMNVSSVANIDYCFIRVGTDASNYNEWRIDDTAIRVGWNSFRFNINAPATAGTLGNGWNSSIVTYIALGCNHDLETDLLADVRVDHIVVHAGLQVAADVNANASSSGVGGTDVNISKVGGNATDTDSGTSGIGTIRVTNSTDDILSVSDDDNANTATNPIYFQPTDAAAVNAVDHPIYVAASKDTSANADGNRIFVQDDVTKLGGVAITLNTGVVGTGVQRVTNATDDIFSISDDDSANTATNPIYFQPTNGTGVNAQDKPIFVAVSKDTAINSDTNRIFVKNDMDKVAGTATNVDGGNMDGGTQTVTLADDDPAVLALAALAGAIIVDSAAFTPAVDSVAMAGFEFDDVAPTAVQEGDGGAARMTSNRSVHMVMRDAAGNERGLEITASGGAEVDIATQTLTAVKVSKDAAVNATGNRMWVKSDTDMVGGTAINTDGGNRDAGTATVAIADDDPVAVSVAHLDAWDDGSDRANVNVERDYVLDGMNATAGWTVGNDATANIALSANHIQGTGSLTFDKINGTNFTEAFIQKTIASVNLDDYETHNVLEWALYASDLTDVVYSFIRIGTDNANYSEWRVLVDDLTAGRWNAVAMFAGDVEYAVVGTGIVATAVTYIAVGVSFGLEDDLLAVIGVDELMVHESQHTTASITSEVTSSVNTANVNLLKVGNKVTNIGAGNAGTGTQRVSISTDDVNLSKLTVEDMDTAGPVDNKQVVAIVTQSATGAQLNSGTYPVFVSAVVTGDTFDRTSVGPDAVGNTATEILSDIDISKAGSWGIQIDNNGGGTGSDFTDVDVQVSRDGGTTWTSLTWEDCDDLTSAAAPCDYDFPMNSYDTIKVYITSVVDTTATVNLSARGLPGMELGAGP